MLAPTTQYPPADFGVHPDAGVYYISNRPEAYEVFGEVSLEEASRIARLISEHAARHFPGIEFWVDSRWHSHQPGMEKVAAYIESHWQGWVHAASSGMADR